MTMFKNWLPQGVIPAVLLPFEPDFSIDAAAYRKHLRDVAAVPGLSALTVNGHSCEVHALNLDEQTMGEVADLLQATIRKARRIADQSAKRNGKASRPVQLVTARECLQPR